MDPRGWSPGGGAPEVGGFGDLVFGLGDPDGGAGPHGFPGMGGIHPGNLLGPAGALDETAQLAGGGALE